jgi:anti-sigma B factor antagonist
MSIRRRAASARRLKMRLESVKHGKVMVVRVLESRMDIRDVDDFKAAMAGYIGKGSKLIALDLSGVDFIDSSGLGAIVSSLKLLGGEGDLVISGATPTVLSLFKLTRIDRVFTLVETEEDALRTLSA